ncbi:arylesterase [Paludibacterium paludis]|uniref:Esterase TesA n=1 Tax=Paludibacterium paludis TaxID=1225769 RepID=A0A918P5S6_9NEIS|nr:arylesterase [Paludibacterium paludis]GGY27478.1 esterase TesA [Paludibacterium paludis]
MKKLAFLLLSLIGLAAHGSTVLVFGDSLSAGYGLRPAEGWVALLQKELGPAHRVINASLSGETTAGGLARLPEALSAHRPDIVVLELGGNDGLRGLPLTDMKTNLAAMIRASRASGAKVVLVGMALPPNYGPDYTRRFTDVYRQLARQYSTAWVPLLVEGFAADLSQFQSDGIHPTAAAQPRMMRNVRARLPLR